MKLACVADLHGNLPDIPECDLLLIAGDICPHAGTVEVEAFGHKRKVRVNVGSHDDMFFQMKWLLGPFKEWLDAIPAKHVVACWGNHDFIGERSPDMVPKSLRWHLLTDQTVVIDGFKIFGSPYQPWFYDWSFNSPGKGGDPDGEAFLKRHWDMMPMDTDIAVIHGPPAGYGDITLEGDPTGSTSLTARIKEVKPQLVVSGHIHEGYGFRRMEVGNRPMIQIVNASVLDRRYEMVNAPILVEIEAPRTDV